MQSQFWSNSKLYLTDVAIGQFHLLEVIFNIILGESKNNEWFNLLNTYSFFYSSKIDLDKVRNILIWLRNF
jgi:hypothetical protein